MSAIASSEWRDRQLARRAARGDAVALFGSGRNRQRHLQHRRRRDHGDVIDADFLRQSNSAPTLRGSGYGGGLRVELPGSDNDKSMLLDGPSRHRFSGGEAARRPFTISAAGRYPGVADMKAGLVMNSFVLAAFRRAGNARPLVGLYTGDEEAGSPASRQIIEAEARNAAYSFNSEPGLRLRQCRDQRGAAAYSCDFRSRARPLIPGST